MKDRAAAIWDEQAPALVLQGMLTPRDTLTFALWCQLGAKLESGELTAALITQFRLIGNDFGMTPSGKGRELGVIPVPGGPRAPGVPGAAPSATTGAGKFFDE